MSDPTLWQLLQAASPARVSGSGHGDRGSKADLAVAQLAAREALLAAFADPLWRVARALTRHDADAEDLLQETLVAILTGFDRVREEASLRSWAFGVLANTWRRRYVRPRRRRAQPVGAEPLAQLYDDAAPDPLSSLIVREDVGRLREAIAVLSEPQRVVIALRYGQDLPYDAIAEATDTTVARVKSRLFEARKRLGKLLGLGGDREDNSVEDSAVENNAVENNAVENNALEPIAVRAAARALKEPAADQRAVSRSMLGSSQVARALPAPP